MNKLLRFFDDNVLKWGVALTLLFTALYPKLPSIQVTHTWVYIRLEDFLITLIVFIWVVQLLRKKVKLPFPVAVPIIIYWLVGLISLVFSLIFIAPHLANFFPKIAMLQYLRRIEYMILFFVAFATIKTKKDIRDYLIVLFFTVFGIILYGFGQRFYISWSHIFPWFYSLLEKNPYLYCFPSFLTGNEEFAKGTPFCLSETSRITSTFGGHYDLAAYLVFIIPVIIGVFLVIKKRPLKIITGVLAIFAIFLLNFTSSRVSFFSYMIGVISMLIFWKQKKWIFPVLLVSFIVLVSFNGSTLQRILKTIQPVQIVTVNPGAANLPPNLQKIITKTKQTEENQTPEKPPPGTFTIGSGIPTANLTASSGAISAVVTDTELKKLQKENQSIEISTVSGSFLVQKAYALDISFTTRFQAEWPRDWTAFIKSPVLGTGYSSLTLASDNDYLRALGETGFLGFFSFVLIFIVFGIYMKHLIPFVTDNLTSALVFGLSGGIVGLLANAIMIDVFEASKVAEPLWILLGVAAGGLALYKKDTIKYSRSLFIFFTSKILIACYLLIATCIVFIGNIGNFFVADDFTWLRWAASATGKDLGKYFINSGGFFYRPLDKVIMYILYACFSFHPEGYHLFILFLHFLVSLGVYFLFVILLKKKLWAFIGALLFLILPAHAENIYWLSTISVTLSTVFIIYSVIAWIQFRKKSLFWYGTAIILSILALFSYEMAVILPALLLLSDFLISKTKKDIRTFIPYIPFVFILGGYALIRKVSQTVSLGGDYSYSIAHFIPNFFGNLLGYVGIFLTGEYFLPAYTLLRTDLKVYALQIFIALAIVLVIAVFILAAQKNKFTYMNQQQQVILYGILFAIISLLPFIGLGNISGRYIYLASLGFLIFFFGIGQYVYIYFEKRAKTITQVITFFIVLSIVVCCILAVKQEANQWQNAGNLTRKTLITLRTNYPNTSRDAHFYFVNVPIRKQNAWIFPVGLPDAIWFIYRDTTPVIYQVKTTDQAKELSKSSTKIKSYIFSFDKEGSLGVLEK